ncbi:hypothetical protein K0U07_04145 [bacterium]|nr:hypothetical protein [bacterium]
MEVNAPSLCEASYSDLDINEVKSVIRCIRVVRKGAQEGYTSLEKEVALEWLKIIANMYFLPIKKREVETLAVSLENICERILKTRRREIVKGIVFLKTRDTLLQKKEMRLHLILEIVRGKRNGLRKRISRRTFRNRLDPRVALLVMSLLHTLFPTLFRVSFRQSSGLCHKKTLRDRVKFWAKQVVKDVKVQLNELR